MGASLIASTRASTGAQYKSCWKHFQDWLSSHASTSISKGSIYLYLLELSSSRNLNPKTILVYRNALHLPLLHGFHISTKDKEFSMLASHHFISNPPRQRLIPNWDPSKVLSMLKSSEYDILLTTTHKLFSKTLFLVALATGNRTAEIAAFSRHSLTFSPSNDRVTIPVRLGFLYKYQSLARTPPNVVIPALRQPDGSHHPLCPVASLRAWLSASSEGTSDAVFINPTSLKPMNRGAVSFQLVRTINSAIPNAFARAHDIQKVSGSLAWSRGISPGDITSSMFWTSSSVFINKYLSRLETHQPCVVASRATHSTII